VNGDTASSIDGSSTGLKQHTTSIRHNLQSHRLSLYLPETSWSIISSTGSTKDGSDDVSLMTALRQPAILTHFYNILKEVYAHELAGIKL
jgi:hypothetical protein